MPTNTSQRQIIPTNTCHRQIMPTNTSQRQIIPTNTSQRQIIPTNTRSVNERLFQLTQDLSTADYSNEHKSATDYAN